MPECVCIFASFYLVMQICICESADTVTHALMAPKIKLCIMSVHWTGRMNRSQNCNSVASCNQYEFIHRGQRTGRWKLISVVPQAQISVGEIGRNRSKSVEIGRDRTRNRGKSAKNRCRPGKM